MMSDQRKYNGVLPLDFSTASTDPMTNDQMSAGEVVERQHDRMTARYIGQMIAAGRATEDDIARVVTHRREQALSRTPSHGKASEIEKRCRALSVILANILGGGSEWFSKAGDEYYIDPKVAGPELQRRKTDAAITKKALFRANRVLSTPPETVAAPIPVEGEVIQADREAAAQMISGTMEWWNEARVRDGEYDNHRLVTAFAAHRRASLSSIEEPRG